MDIVVVWPWILAAMPAYPSLRTVLMFGLEHDELWRLAFSQFLLGATSALCAEVPSTFKRNRLEHVLAWRQITHGRRVSGRQHVLQT